MMLKGKERGIAFLPCVCESCDTITIERGEVMRRGKLPLRST